MDEIQLRYKRLLEISEYDLQYKDYTVTYGTGYFNRKDIIKACCKQHAIDIANLKNLKIISIKPIALV